MDAFQLRLEITEQFGDAVASDEKLVAECINMCQIFNISPETLFYKWEALSFNSMRSANFFTMDSAASLKASIQRELVAQNTRKQQDRPKLSGAVIRGRVPASRPHLSKPTNASSSPTLAGPSIKAEQDWSATGLSKVDYRGPNIDPMSKKTRAYRYMYEKITERSEVLNDQLGSFAELVREHCSVEDLGDPTMATEDEVTVVGRIVLDAESSSSGGVKLNEASLVLESSRSMGSGRRIAIRFDNGVKLRGGAEGAEKMGFFPGKIVALKGKNASGSSGYFVVNEIITMPPMKPSPLAKAKTWSGKPFTMCIASGSYTMDTDLKYEPWYRILASLKISKPEVVLLMGPFVDSTHPQIKNGELDHSPSDLFRKHFTEGLREFLSLSPGSIVVIVPSIRDLLSDHAAFPQCELDANMCGSDARIHMLPNPCRFTVNGVSFATLSVDVISHLKKEEFIKHASALESLPDSSGPDLMSATCRHLLEQRSFYPLFPVPFDLINEVNLDVSHSEMLRLDYGVDHDHAPDVLIVPSKLKHFAKMVQNTVFVNPSIISKGAFATLSLLAGVVPGERIKVEMGRLDGGNR